MKALVGSRGRGYGLITEAGLTSGTMHMAPFQFEAYRRKGARTVCAIALALSSAAAAPAFAQHVQSEHVRAQLVSEHLALVPGQSMQVGLLLQHEPHWHTYWTNPGDSGLPTTLEWNPPAGFKAQDIAWPLPKRFDVGGLYNFGYDDEVLLPVTLAVPADARPGTRAHITANAKWLVCREECVPEKASLVLDLPIAAAPAKPDPRWTKQFATARLAQPQATAWKGEARLDGDRVVIALRGPGLPPAEGLDVFVTEKKIFDNKPPTIRKDGDALIVEAGKSEYFATSPATIDLVVTAPAAAGVRGWHVQIPFTDASAPAH
jgi:DsbC/DsbD-like thiol-disulfide interchange protein